MLPRLDFPQLDFPPQTLSEEMACYSLPFGGLGFLSHVLAYYTMICLTLGKSPFRPWKDLTQTMFDLLLGAVGLVGGSVLTIYTMVKCRNHWQLLIIAVWKFSMSLLNGAVAVHVSMIVRKWSRVHRARKRDGRESRSSGVKYNRLHRNSAISHQTDRSSPGPMDAPRISRAQYKTFHTSDITLDTLYNDSEVQINPSKNSSLASKAKGVGDEEAQALVENTLDDPPSSPAMLDAPNTAWALLWILLYIPGMIAGITGLLSLVVEHWSRNLELLTYTFFTVLALCEIVLWFYIVASDEFFASSREDILAFWFYTFCAFALFSILAPLYSDWALGIMTKNLLGAPAGDNAVLFYSYFFLKRLTMFSW